MSINQVIQKINDDIARTGRSIMGVISSFYYTIGQANKNQPDVIITCNMNANTAAYILNDVCNRIEKGELTEGRSDEILSGFDAYLLPCTLNSSHLHDEYVVQAQSHYARQNITSAKYWQLVLPDTENLFPWDEGYNKANTMPPQPVFCEPTANLH